MTIRRPFGSLENWMLILLEYRKGTFGARGCFIKAIGLGLPLKRSESMVLPTSRVLSIV